MGDISLLCDELDDLRLPDSDDNDPLDELLARVKAAGYPLETLIPMLHVLENHPEHDFGAPGSLVHTIESVKISDDEYFDLVIDSVGRRPTEYNLWLMSRVMNSFDNSEAVDRGIAVFHQVALDTTNDTIKSAARDFIVHFPVTTFTVEIFPQNRPKWPILREYLDSERTGGGLGGRARVGAPKPRLGNGRAGHKQLEIVASEDRSDWYHVIALFRR